jgi:hypothetical protein
MLTPVLIPARMAVLVSMSVLVSVALVLVQVQTVKPQAQPRNALLMPVCPHEALAAGACVSHVLARDQLHNSPRPHPPPRM